MRGLKDLVGGFLVTFVEREGRLGGTSLDRAEALVREAGACRVTIAGGVTTPEEIATLDGLGADAQVGMAIYTGRMDLADAIAAPLVSDRPDGLWPTLICDPDGRALGLAYSDLESLRHAVRTRSGAYQSRKRGLWVKGATSGARQELLRIDLDCDRDALRFTVRQRGSGSCHTGAFSCFGEARGLAALERTLASRRLDAPAGSYSQRLFDDPALLAAKLKEEAAELAVESAPDRVAEEAADLLYFALAKMTASGTTLEDVARVLDARALGVTRRPGSAKTETPE
jgi:phosphoribosyl-ATP pyrophosphohydrolase